MVDALKVLNAGDPAVTEIFTFITTDSEGVETTHLVTINVTGTNDAPVIRGHSSTAVTANTDERSNLEGNATEAGGVFNGKGPDNVDDRRA